MKILNKKILTLAFFSVQGIVCFASEPVFNIETATKSRLEGVLGYASHFEKLSQELDDKIIYIDCKSSDLGKLPDLVSWNLEPDGLKWYDYRVNVNKDRKAVRLTHVFSVDPQPTDIERVAERKPKRLEHWNDEFAGVAGGLDPLALLQWITARGHFEQQRDIAIDSLGKL